MNNQTNIPSSNFRPTAINHAMVVASWELPYNGDKLILTEQHSQAVVAANRAAGIEVEPYRMYEEVDGKIDNVGDFSTVDEAQEYFYEIYDAIIYAAKRDEYYAEYFAEYFAEKNMKDEIEMIRQENLDTLLDKYEL